MSEHPVAHNAEQTAIVSEPRSADLDEANAVLFIDDVAKMLRTSRATLERRRREGSFPIPELPSIDNRPRWSRKAVERYLSSTKTGLALRRRGFSRR